MSDFLFKIFVLPSLGLCRTTRLPPPLLCHSCAPACEIKLKAKIKLKYLQKLGPSHAVPRSPCYTRS